MFRSIISIAALALAAGGVPAAAQAQATSDADYMVRVNSAAPASLVKDATIVRMDADGSMRTLQSGSNGFTCMVVGPDDPMCADKNAVAWLHAMMKHAAPPSGVGMVYMLGGDRGASNTDPMATEQSATNHWIVTGPHVMIVGPNWAAMGYPAAADADPTKPYVMWANTPYAHLMVPVTVPAP